LPIEALPSFSGSLDAPVVPDMSTGGNESTMLVDDNRNHHPRSPATIVPHQQVSTGVTDGKASEMESPPNALPSTTEPVRRSERTLRPVDRLDL